MKRLLFISLIVLSLFGCDNVDLKREKIARMNDFVGRTITYGDKKIDVVEYYWTMGEFKMSNGDFISEIFVLKKLNVEKIVVKSSDDISIQTQDFVSDIKSDAVTEYKHVVAESERLQAEAQKKIDEAQKKIDEANKFVEENRDDISTY